LLPATPYEAGLETAERIRSIIEGHGVAIEASGAAVHVTISIGLSMLDVADQSAQAETLANEMVARADKALYAAKAAGRNRVLSAPELAP
jgi:diguanylate cyclase (GGDEF)-like protein